jgi:hypothetical protein
LQVVGVLIFTAHAVTAIAIVAVNWASFMEDKLTDALANW